MSKTNMGHIWSKKHLDQAICSLVSKALRDAHRNSSAARKQIARITHLQELTIKKWYEGKNPPDAAHLLILMVHYPDLLRGILHLIKRADLWELGVRAGIPEKIKNALAETHPQHKIWGDIRVTPPASENSVKLNHRQLWFLEELARKLRMQNKDIIAFWGITERTAKRDTQGLLRARLIRTMRKGSSSWYESTGEKYDR